MNAGEFDCANDAVDGADDVVDGANDALDGANDAVDAADDAVGGADAPADDVDKGAVISKDAVPVTNEVAGGIDNNVDVRAAVDADDDVTNVDVDGRDNGGTVDAREAAVDVADSVVKSVETGDALVGVDRADADDAARKDEAVG